MVARRIGIVACALLAAPALITGQQGAVNGEWPAYGGDLGHTRYSSLAQIDATNFNKLEVAWRFKTDSLGPRPEYQFESTPLMVKGCGDGRDAVDAQRERRRARRERAASTLWARSRVLGGCHWSK
jgi:hypothetical protein